MTRLAQGEALADRLAMYDGLWRPVPRAVAFSAIHHRCFGLWRRRARRASVAVAGGVIGIGVATLLSPAHPLAVTALAAVLGAVLMTALWHELP